MRLLITAIAIMLIIIIGVMSVKALFKKEEVENSRDFWMVIKSSKNHGALPVWRCVGHAFSKEEAMAILSREKNAIHPECEEVMVFKDTYIPSPFPININRRVREMYESYLEKARSGEPLDKYLF